jgi:hypothetical protein
MTNVCYNLLNSCSACCGLHNINLPVSEKISWLRKNSSLFLSLDLSDRASVINFRHSGEQFLQPKAIRKDVYICPFMGLAPDITNAARLKTGCLLHKTGSPHNQIKGSESPQNFSFYGESICKSYDCLSKQSISPCFDLIHEVCKSNDSLTYGKIVSNHNLLHICLKLSDNNMEYFKKLLRYIVEILKSAEIPVTSFEMSLDLTSYTQPELWSVLGTMFDNKGYLFDAFQVSEQGVETGKKIEKNFVNTF